MSNKPMSRKEQNRALAEWKLSTAGIPQKEIESIIDLLSNSYSFPRWLSITLKVLLYAVGLILAGIGTTSCVSLVGIL